MRINPSLTVRFHASHRASATRVVKTRRRVELEGVFYFFRTRIDRPMNRVILFMCPHKVGVFFFIFLGARGRGPHSLSLNEEGGE